VFDSTVGEVWCKLLFNAMSIPFAILLTVLVSSQLMTARSHAGAEPAGDPSELVGEVLF